MLKWHEMVASMLISHPDLDFFHNGFDVTLAHGIRSKVRNHWHPGWDLQAHAVY